MLLYRELKVLFECLGNPVEFFERKLVLEAFGF